MTPEIDNEILPFAPDIFTAPPYADHPPSLLGGFCAGCNEYFFPLPRYCPKCLGKVRKKEIGSKGTIYSFTVVRTPPAYGFPSPYSIGYIDLAETGLRVLGLFNTGPEDDLRIGADVVLSVTPFGTDEKGRPQLRPCFVIAKKNQTVKER